MSRNLESDCNSHHPSKLKWPVWIHISFNSEDSIQLSHWDSELLCLGVIATSVSHSLYISHHSLTCEQNVAEGAYLPALEVVLLIKVIIYWCFLHVVYTYSKQPLNYILVSPFEHFKRWIWVQEFAGPYS